MGEEQWEQQRRAALKLALDTAGRVVLPPPCVNEPLAAYVTRVIVEDLALLKLKACSRAFPPQLFQGGTGFFRRHGETGASVSAFPVEVWPRFSPAWFSPADVIAGHDGLDLVRLDVSERTAKRLDWIWERGPGDMLDVRMAREPRYDLGDKLPPRNVPPPRNPFLVEMEAEVLKVWRAGARRRDVMTAMLCDGIRNGTMIVTGFLVGDVNRRNIKIQPGWWSDPLLACGWQQGELRPLEEAPSGTPHFRAMQLSPGSRQKSAANRPAKASPPGSGPGRGRLPDPVWDNIKPSVMKWLDQNGMPLGGSGEQAKLEAFVEELLSRRKHHGAGESTIRGHVRSWMDEHSERMRKGQ